MPKVVIVGAGIGGITAAILLKQKLGFTDFTLYEKAADVGGTWRDNTYPGCNCDTPSHWYCLSSELSPDFSETHPSQPEIQAYWKDLVKKHALHRHISFNANVVAAIWDSDKQFWDVEVEDSKSGTKTRSFAEIVISAIGVLRDPIFPADIPGRETFKGDLFHSARWDHSVDFKAKRVVVIGNAASAAQFVPYLVAEPTTHVVNFIRTPQWFVHRDRWVWSPLARWIFANIPFSLRLHRLWTIFSLEILPYVQKHYLHWQPTLSREEELTELIRRKAPAHLHDNLIPKYPTFCKRSIMDGGYLSCLHQSNIELNFDGIHKITEDGLTTKTGEHIPCDAIIFATGYVAESHTVDITGAVSTLQEYYDAHQGPTAYRGVTVPGFPNLYLVGGPNTVTAGSQAVSIETTVNHALHLVKPVLKGLASSFEVKSEATEAYNTMIQKYLSSSDRAGCITWFRTGRVGKNFVVYPGTTAGFWWSGHKPIWDHYIVMGGERWQRYRKLQRIKKFAGTIILVLALVFVRARKDTYPRIFSNLLSSLGL